MLTNGKHPPAKPIRRDGDALRAGMLRYLSMTEMGEALELDAAGRPRRKY